MRLRLYEPYEQELVEHLLRLLDRDLTLVAELRSLIADFGPPGVHVAGATAAEDAENTGGSDKPAVSGGEQACSRRFSGDRDGIRGGWAAPDGNQTDADSVELTGEFTIDYAPPTWYRQSASGLPDAASSAPPPPPSAQPTGIPPQGAPSTPPPETPYTPPPPPHAPAQGAADGPGSGAAESTNAVAQDGTNEQNSTPHPGRPKNDAQTDAAPHTGAPQDGVPPAAPLAPQGWTPPPAPQSGLPMLPPSYQPAPPTPTAQWPVQPGQQPPFQPQAPQSAPRGENTSAPGTPLAPDGEPPAYTDRSSHRDGIPEGWDTVGTLPGALTCPNGHQSGAEDRCDVCGHRMASAVPPPPQGYQPDGRSHLSAVPDPEPELCPQCRTPREGGAPFCEECRWNWRPLYGGGDSYDRQSSRPSQKNRPAEPIPPGAPFGSEPSGPPSPFADRSGFGPDPSRPVPPPRGLTPRGGPGGPGAPGGPSGFGGAPQAFQQPGPPAPPPFPQETSRPPQPGGPSFGYGEDDWVISPPSGGPGAGGLGTDRPGAPPEFQQAGHGGDDGSSESRRLIAELAAQTSPGREVPLHVQLVLDSGRINRNSGRSVPLRSFFLPRRGARVLVTIHAPGLVSIGELQQDIHITPGRDSEVLLFRLKASTPGLHDVTVRAFRGGTFLGEVTCQISVEHGSVTRDGPQHEAPLPSLAFDPGEVTLQVLKDKAAGAYSFQLISETFYAPEVFHFRAGDPSRATEQIYAQLRSAAKAAAGRDAGDAQRLRDRLRNHGVQLWTSVVPQAVQNQFWEEADQVTAFTVLGEHDIVPWELLYPLNEGRQDWGFLAEWLPVVRRVFGQDRVRNISLPGAAFVVPPGSPTDADEEVASLRARLGGRMSDAGVLTDRAALTALIEGGHAGLLHFACHNAFTGAGSCVTMADGPFDPIDLASAAQLRTLRPHRPLVFFNACRSAGEIDWFGESLGWAPQFLNAGAGAFLGTLWPVRSRSAREFAEAFYDQLITRRRPLGLASLFARQTIRDMHGGDPTWLAYAVYGSPAATAQIAA